MMMSGSPLIDGEQDSPLVRGACVPQGSLVERSINPMRNDGTKTSRNSLIDGCDPASQAGFNLAKPSLSSARIGRES